MSERLTVPRDGESGRDAPRVRGVDGIIVILVQTLEAVVAKVELEVVLDDLVLVAAEGLLALALDLALLARVLLRLEDLAHVKVAPALAALAAHVVLVVRPDEERELGLLGCVGLLLGLALLALGLLRQLVPLAALDTAGTANLVPTVGPVSYTHLTLPTIYSV